jgi:formate C-acetyltransferase
MQNKQFKPGLWQETIDTRDFIFNNFTPYEGDSFFLAGPTTATKKLWAKSSELLKQEIKNGGVLDVDTKTISSITSHKPGYLDKKIEKIVGFQTDQPLKRAMKPYGGIRVVEAACEENGYKVDPGVSEIFNKYRKSHNDGVFDAYTKTMRQLRSTGILTGLPDNYARGRIIGDYRRVALYGIDRLIEAKNADKDAIDGVMTDEVIRLREEVRKQIKALKEMKEMAASYGFDISKPATNAQEAIQWTWFAFLAALKEQDGAAMSLGNVSTFFDIYIERDLQNGDLTEETAQELVDHFIMKCRLIRHLRMDAYNQLFAGDPTWITEAIGGFFANGQHKITKTSFRFLQSLYNIGPAPEPNLTILWSDKLPEGFKKFCAQVSIDTSSLQYENDNLMRAVSHCDDIVLLVVYP